MSEVPVNFGLRAMADPGQGHEPPLVTQETIRCISYSSNFSAETKATLLG